MRHECTLVTRGYEMDHRGYVPPAVLARYLEHARWRALGSPQGGLAWAFSGGRKLVVRAQRMDVGVRVLHDVPLCCELTLAHVGRTSLRFAQRALREDDGALVCHAEVTVVLVGPDGRPAAVPDFVRQDTTASEVPGAAALGDATPPEGAFRRSVALRPSDLDTLQHVNQSRYVEMFDDTRQLAARAGAYGEACQRALRPVQALAVDYLRETRLGQAVCVVSWALSESGGFGFELRAEQGGAVFSRGRLETAA